MNVDTLKSGCHHTLQVSFIASSCKHSRVVSLEDGHDFIRHFRVTTIMRLQENKVGAKLLGDKCWKDLCEDGVLTRHKKHRRTCHPRTYAIFPRLIGGSRNDSACNLDRNMIHAIAPVLYRKRTANGFPCSDGSSRSSTLQKNASMSTCTMI